MITATTNLWVGSKGSGRYSLFFTLTLLLLLTMSSSTSAKRGCSAFGHSCFGGHGKRAEMPLQLPMSGEDSMTSADEEIPVRGSRLSPLQTFYPLASLAARPLAEGPQGPRDRGAFAFSDAELYQLRMSPLLRRLVSAAGRELDNF